MRNLLLTLLTTALAICAIAQDASIPTSQEKKKKNKIIRPAKCPGIYVTTSTGINNNTGIIGFSFDVPVSKNVSIDAGPGAGTWNYKLYLGAKYYLQPCHRGFALGAGFTYCTGVYHDNATLNTIYGYSQDIYYNKNPQTSMMFAAYKYWNMGKKYNRFYAELGWTVPLSFGDKVTQVSGEPMTSSAMDDLRSGFEGGPILAIGVSFGMN